MIRVKLALALGAFLTKGVMSGGLPSAHICAIASTLGQNRD